ncbi:MAG TPA: ABC transporter permease subunit [Gaiellaceae bacterium]|nr:ABC transporter permease subunit [Gaiellaceae bacterium]
MAASTEALATPSKPRVLGWGRLPAVLRYSVVAAVLVVFWHLYAVHKGPLVMATPRQAVEAVWDGWKDGSLAHSTWTTLRLLFEGIGIGIAIAALLVAFATLSKFGADVLAFLTAVLNPLPGVAVLPLAMLIFGLNETAILFVLANATIWPLAIAVSTGFKTTNQTLVSVGRNVGLRRVRIITDVLAPAALPYAVTGLKTAWAFGWRTIIAAELVFGVAGAKGGLGNYINDARLNLLPPKMFAALLMIAGLGVLFETLFNLLERHTVVRWGMKTS